MSRQSVLVIAGFLLLTGCNKAFQGHWENGAYHTPTAYTSAEVRIIEQRAHPTIPGRDVVCTEPTPDVAEALSTAAQLQGNGSSGPGNAGIGVAFASQEALAELAGRSTALLGLRDGLFRACEAYANGAIGDAAYALILSRYGQLMATLFLGQDAQGAAASAAGAAFASEALQLSLQSKGANSGTESGGAAGSTQAPAKQPTSASKKNAAPPPSLLQQIALLSSRNGSIDSIADQPPTAAPTPHGVTRTPPAKATPHTGAPAPKKGPPTPPVAATQTPTPPTSSENKGTGTASAIAIEAMQGKYIDIDTDPRAMLHFLLVACVNEFDPTRPDYTWTIDNTGRPVLDSAHRRARAVNPFLERMCRIENMKNLVVLLAKFQPTVQPARPPSPAISPVAARPSANVRSLQTQLQSEHYYSGPIDGFYGPETDDALGKFLAKQRGD